MILFLLFFSVFAESRENQKPEWKGKIETENGIKVIKNPREPLYGEIKLDLQEDLNIGREDDDNYFFYRFVDITVDSTGNIYVSDLTNYRVQKFDKNGNYILTIGRKGQGPGEFQQPSSLCIDNKDRICILEQRRIHIFDMGGQFIKGIALQHGLESLNFTKTGDILGKLSTRINKDEMKEEIALFSPEGKQLTSIMSSSLPIINIPDKTAVVGGSIFNPHLLFIPWSKGSAIYGHSSEYKLFFLDSLGQVSLIVQKEEGLEAITSKEKKEYFQDIYESEKKSKLRFPNRKTLSVSEIEKAYALPKYKPFFMLLLSDDEGNVYVVRMPPVNIKEKRSVEFGFFNAEGFYLYKIKMPFLPRLIKNGLIYRQQWDAKKGLFFIRRYKIKNWEQIKAGI